MADIVGEYKSNIVSGNPEAAALRFLNISAIWFRRYGGKTSGVKYEWEGARARP